MPGDRHTLYHLQLQCPGQVESAVGTLPSSSDGRTQEYSISIPMFTFYDNLPSDKDRVTIAIF